MDLARMITMGDTEVIQQTDFLDKVFNFDDHSRLSMTDIEVADALFSLDEDRNDVFDQLQSCESSERDIMTEESEYNHRRQAGVISIGQWREMSFDPAASRNREKMLTWTGFAFPSPQSLTLPYSCKVFLGGIPPRITTGELHENFRRFELARVEWPTVKISRTKSQIGYVYLLFKTARGVSKLLQNCVYDKRKGGWYFQLTGERFSRWQSQVMPWSVDDSHHIRVTSVSRGHEDESVFVGGLHGMITAERLSHIMDALFGGVIYAVLDVDRYNYPIGSGRVVFSCRNSFRKAVEAAFVGVRTDRYLKIIQIDPYLTVVENCNVCRSTASNVNCFKYTSKCITYLCTKCEKKHHCKAVPKYEMMSVVKCLSPSS